MTRKLLSGLLLALVCSAAQADAMLDFVDDASGAPQTRLSVAGGKLRIEAAGSGAYTIIDLAQRTLTQVNATQRTTTTTSIEQVQAIVQSMNSVDPSASPLLQLAMENLPDAQRAQAEQMLRQSKADEAIAYTKTGARGSAAGIACEIYQQRSGSGDVRTLCAAAFGDLKLSAGDERTLRDALQLLRETGGPWVRAAQVPGLPLRYSGSFGNEAYGGAGRLQSISLTPLPPQRFSAPREYRIVSLLEMLSNGTGF